MRRQISENKFLNGLYQYRLFIFAIFFVIIVPITLISFLYLGTYFESKKVNFTENISSSKFSNALVSVVDNKVQYHLDLIDFELYLNFNQITLPTKNTSEDEDGKKTESYVNGRYHFSTYFSNKKGNVSEISANFALQTQWMDTLSTTSRPLSSSSDSFTISYNHILPKWPLWFVKVERPDLYVHLNYTVDGMERNVFIKMNLQDALVTIK